MKTYPGALADREGDQGVQVVLVAVDAAGRQQPHDVQYPVVLHGGGDGTVQGFVGREFAALDGTVDACQILVDDPARAEVHVSHLGVAHLAAGQPDAGSGSVQPGLHGARPQPVPMRRTGRVDGVVVGLVAEPPAIEHDQ